MIRTASDALATIGATQDTSMTMRLWTNRRCNPDRREHVMHFHGYSAMLCADLWVCDACPHQEMGRTDQSRARHPEVP